VLLAHSHHFSASDLSKQDLFVHGNLAIVACKKQSLEVKES